jgi:hypothetical protein
MDVNSVGYTSQITAGFRAVELSHNPHPIIVDQLAQHLAGNALQTALADYQKLQHVQGAGRSLRVPARNRVMDDYLLDALQQLQQLPEQQASDGVVQVVNIGCGMVSEQRHLIYCITLPAVASVSCLCMQACIHTNPGLFGSRRTQPQTPTSVTIVHKWSKVAAMTYRCFPAGH